MQQGRQRPWRHQFLGQPEVFIHEEPESVHCSKSDVFLYGYSKLHEILYKFTMTPTLTWVDFHQKIKSFQIKLGEISPIPFPEIDFPEETRLLVRFCVFFFVENPENP